MRGEGGGVTVKVLVGALVALFVLVLLGFVYASRQRPLQLGDVSVGATGGAGNAHTLRLAPDGRVYVATIVHNTGRLPVTLQGLGEADALSNQPYVPVQISLGDGRTASPEAAAAFSPTRLGPGTGVGVVVTLAVNPDFACEKGFARGSTKLPAIPLRFTTYGLEATQLVRLGKDVPAIEPSTEQRCEAAVASA
jgi:hypothetical protein